MNKLHIDNTYLIRYTTVPLIPYISVSPSPSPAQEMTYNRIFYDVTTKPTNEIIGIDLYAKLHCTIANTNCILRVSNQTAPRTLRDLHHKFVRS